MGDNFETGFCLANLARLANVYCKPRDVSTFAIELCFAIDLERGRDLTYRCRKSPGQLQLRFLIVGFDQAHHQLAILDCVHVEQAAGNIGVD